MNRFLPNNLPTLSSTNYLSTKRLVDGTLRVFSYNYYAGTASMRSFMVWEFPPAGNILISAPANFEISLDAASGYSSALNLPRNNGSLDPAINTFFYQL